MHVRCFFDLCTLTGAISKNKQNFEKWRHSDCVLILRAHVLLSAAVFARLEKCLDEDRAAAERTETNLKCDIKDLQEALQEAKDQVAFLQKYKTGYDELQSGW